MNIERLKHEDGSVTIKLSGEITSKDYRQLIDTVSEVVTGERTPLVTLDLAGVALIDSVGLGALLKIYTLVKKSDTDLILTNLRPTILESLKVTKLDTILPIR